MIWSLHRPLWFWLGTIVASAAGIAAGDEASRVNFNRDVRPILSEACFNCHGPDAETRRAGLRLDQAESASYVVEPGDVEASELARRILADDPDVRMPPPEALHQLADSQRALIVRWIEQGARFETHWSFRPPQRPEPPAVNDTADSPSNPERRAVTATHPIDRFLRARLAEVGLEPAPPAQRATLIRRVTFDLTGLPPTPAEVDAFVRDNSPDAYRRLIDRLMASPRYGEHMALPWLEAARYADTDGYQNDRYRYQHVWRDWVIRAFNDKMPYDQFVIEQLAGDMLPDATLSQQIATGFCRNHRINSEDGSIPEEWRTEYVVDRVDTLGTVFMGLTVGCARCHDHKYDPISQRDYYELFAYFNNVPEWGVGPNNGNSPPFIEVPESWPDVPADADATRTPEPVKLRRARKNAGNGLKRPQAGSPSTVMVMHELPEPRETYLLARGRYDQPDKSERLWPDVPDAISPDDAATPANRLELARWLVRPDHPLTARVAVNRIWQQFFGTGLVKTSENFGSQGNPPRHPRLLDWLATELVRRDWDLQSIQRQILMSATYRQSSRVADAHRDRDPENRWLSRGPRFRLTPFALRDQALAASGLLVERIGGPSVKPYMPPRIWSSISNNKYEQGAGADLYRRSLYTYWRRTIPPPTMMSFNAAAREVCTVRNGRTNTPLQALTLMNNKLFVEAARFLAERMIREGGSPRRSRLAHGFRLVTGRKPHEREAVALARAYEDFLKQFAGREDAARKLLSQGEAPRDPDLDVTDHAATTMVASILLNLDEAITKE